VVLTRSAREYLLNWMAGQLRRIGVHAHQIEDGGNKTQAIVRLLDLPPSSKPIVHSSKSSRKPCEKW